jgi:hypothetical protein
MDKSYEELFHIFFGGADQTSTKLSVVSILNSLRKGLDEFLKIPVDRNRIDKNMRIGAQMRQRYVDWIRQDTRRAKVSYRKWRVKYSGIPKTIGGD